MEQNIMIMHATRRWSVFYITFSLFVVLTGCDSNNPSQSSPPAMIFTPTLSSSTAAIGSFLGQKIYGDIQAKLVFTIVRSSDQSKKLCYIDFSEDTDTPTVHTIAAAHGAQLPVISPDGNWVVYATGRGSEAGSPINQRSSVYICRLSEDAQPVLVAADSACEPRFIQDTSSLIVVYPTMAPNCAWEGFGKTMAVSIDVSSGEAVVGEPEVLFEHGSYTGGCSWDQRYLCGGGGQIAMLDLKSGKDRPDTVSCFNQSCNASISSSRIYTNTMMHLTTSGSHESINNGKPWTQWQTIIVNDNKRNVLRGYMYPKKYPFPLDTDPQSLTAARWHHSEWSNHPYYATATLNADRYFTEDNKIYNTYYQERIYLINLKDSAYIEVLRLDTKEIRYSGIDGDNSGFHWPWLWVEVADQFKEEEGWLDNKN